METLQTSLEYIVHPSDGQESCDQNMPVNPVNPSIRSRQKPNQQDGAGATAATAPPRKRQHSRVEAVYPRKRAIQACSTCRLRRTKCDNGRPSCSKCVGLGIECVYQQNDPSTYVSSAVNETILPG